MPHSYQGILNAAPADRNHTNNMREAEQDTAPTGYRERLPRLARLAGVFVLVLQVSCQTLTPDEAPTSIAVPTLPVPVLIATQPPPVITPAVEYRLVPDLWRDLRKSFILDHQLDRKRVQQELSWLRRHPDYLPRLQPRLQRFLGYIHQQVLARGLPGELALLPIVESAMDPYAFSHGGAAGLWQFIPTTGKRFGLARNWWYDGRRDPIAATRAALDYLEGLHKRFGDWSLAIAAYNAGEGNVMKARRRGPEGANFWDLPLPRETRAYVPRLLALSAIVANPDHYGLALPGVDPAVPFSIVQTGGQIDLAIAAEHLGEDLETLYRWNPALNQWATPPNGPHRLLVPGGEATELAERLGAIPSDARVRWSRVKVRSGDTLSQLARRHNTDVASLRKANNLRGTTIRIGQALYIPRSSQALDEYPPSRRWQAANYTVRAGDSLWTIGKAHGISVTKLMKANHIGPKDALRVGQRLTIPGGSKQVVRTVKYPVRRGDSLAAIAARFNLQVSQIATWNQLNVNNYLRPGQALTLYVDVAAGD